jgi:apolipoprotein N-acyltransferase
LKARVFLPAMVSAVLLWTAFFPLNLGPVAFVALVPFLTLVRAEGVNPWRRYTAAWLGGLTFGAIALNWIRVAHPMMMYFAWPSLTLFLSLFWPIALYLLRKLDRLGRPPLALTFPLVWIGLEYVKVHFPAGYPFLKSVDLYHRSGFSWYLLGHTQHANLALLQAADLGGAYLVGAAVAAVNGAAHDWAVRIRSFRWFVNLPRVWTPRVFRTEMMHSAGAGCLLVVLLLYGGLRLGQNAFEVGPRVALLQGNISQSEKMAHEEGGQDPATITPLAKEYLPLARKVFRGRANPPDLVIWPETCWEDNWPTVLPGVTADHPQIPNTAEKVWNYQRELARNVREIVPSYALIGLNGDDWDGTRWRKGNTAILLRPDESDFFAGRYDKMHLVPFGEYLPFRDSLPFIKAFAPYGERDYSCTPGENFTRFEMQTVRKSTAAEGGKSVRKTYLFGVLICYEDSDPSLARQYNQWAGGQPVDFLVNMSNDGWFDGTEQHEQHLAVCRFRAVEARRSVVRAVNMGISAVIDPNGRVSNMIDLEWRDSKKHEGTIIADVPIDKRGSVYAAMGDWVPLLCWVGILCGLLQSWRLRTRLPLVP